MSLYCVLIQTENWSGAYVIIIDLWQSTHWRFCLKSSWAPVWVSPVASCCLRQRRWTCLRCCMTALLRCFLQIATKKVTHNTKWIHNEWWVVASPLCFYISAPLRLESQTGLPPIDLCNWFAGSPRWIIPTEAPSRSASAALLVYESSGERASCLCLGALPWCASVCLIASVFVWLARWSLRLADVLKGAAGRGRPHEDEARDGGKHDGRVVCFLGNFAHSEDKTRPSKDKQHWHFEGAHMQSRTRTVESRLYFISFSCWHPLLEQRLLFGRCSFLPFALLAPPPAVLTLEDLPTGSLFSSCTSQKSRKNTRVPIQSFIWKSWSLEFPI